LNALETERGWDGNDLQVRTLYDMNAFAEKEASTHLDIIHYYWSSLQIEKDGLPKISEFHPGEILPDAGKCKVGWIDSSVEDPNNFRMRDHPHNAIQGLGEELSGKFLAEFPNKMHAKSLVLEYLRCKRWRVPLYHEIDQVIDGIGRHYTRLMLPLIDESGMVTRIYYGVSPLVPPSPLYVAD
jgi:hypothetical protein